MRIIILQDLFFSQGHQLESEETSLFTGEMVPRLNNKHSPYTRHTLIGTR